MGHSLGAGVAAILALCLHSKYPSLHCYGYGMPGCVFDYQTCQESNEYVTTLILDNDMVPRTSLQSISKIREDILNSLARAKVHKLKIFQSIFKKSEGENKVESLLFPEGEEPDSLFKRRVERYNTSMFTNRDIYCNGSVIRPLLYLPGKIFHMVKSQEGIHVHVCIYKLVLDLC